MQGFYRLAADLVLIVHASFVAFVVFGLLFIVIGWLRQWAWVRHPWFRWGHLLAIGIVVVQSWLGVLCPLTTLENWLRGQALDTTYEGSFIQYWLHQLLFYQAPGWVFGLTYTLFGLLVVLAWVKFPPRRWQRG